MPKISVLLPVYNAASYVEMAVRSVLAQTLGDFELLIVDDGSTDASLEILRGLAQHDARISLHSRPNAGLVPTLNELVGMAQGRYLARMDADDVCVAHRFERQCAHLDANPLCVAIGSRCLLIDSEGLPITEVLDHETQEQIEISLLDRQLGIVHPSVMLRCDVVRQIGGYRHGFPHAEDLDLFLRLGEVGQLANIQEVLLKYRVHASSVSHANVVAQSDGAAAAVRAARERRRLPPAPPGSLKVIHPETPAQLHRKWSWWALRAGNLRTARKHAGLAIRHEPAFGPNLRLVACVLRDTLRHLR